MTLDTFTDDPVIHEEDIESKSHPGTFHHMTIRKSGAARCSCPGDAQAQSAKVPARCRHITGEFIKRGWPTPWLDRREQDKISRLLAKFKPAHRIKIDIETLKARRLACTSLTIWHDVLFQELYPEKNGKVLRFVIDHPGRSRKEIAEGLYTPINTITQHILDLIKSGLIEERGFKDNDTGYQACMLVPTRLAIELDEVNQPKRTAP
jgi:hypothetical protein